MRFTKVLILCMLLTLLLSSVTAFAAAESIVIDGTTTEIPAEMGSIQEKDNRTFVPVRFIMEYLGCDVVYDDVSSTAFITAPSHSYLIQEGNPTLYILPTAYSETIEKKMDTSAYIESTWIDDVEYGRMYIPIRFLAEAIGYTVGWDEENQIVTLTSETK